MDLGFAGRKVVSYEFGFTVALTFAGGYEVRIETPLVVRAGGVEQTVTPGDESGAPSVAALAGAEVSACVADADGGLRIDFAVGDRVLVVADEDFEAWTFAGPDGAKVVAEPGGGLAVWSPAG